MALTLSERDMSALRGLLLAEPEPGALLPHAAIEALPRLIGCDGFGIAEADHDGWLLRHLDLPDDPNEDPRVCDGPLPSGIRHLAFLRYRGEGDHDYPGDTLWTGFGVGGGTVRQVYFDRLDGRFGERELALLTMLEPAIGRLLRAAPDADSDMGLTPAERRVLMLIGKGATNQEAADCLFVTVATVRKHLENAYRKLGVSNRTAAVMAVRSSA